MNYKSRRGNMAVEFAFMLSVMAIIISGSIDYGVYFHRQAGLTQAAHATARYASLHPNDLDSAIAIGEDSYFGATGQTASISVELTGIEPDLHITVLANAPFNKVVGMVPVPEEHNHTAYIRVSNQ